ncbi:MAG: hypothetical protein QW035_02055 [Candidatus Anstonellales archaeon]
MEAKTMFLGLLLLGFFTAGLSAQGPYGQGACAQVITYAENPSTGGVEAFPTPCDVPKGWKTVSGPKGSLGDGQKNQGSAGGGQGNGLQGQDGTSNGASSDFIRVFVYDAGNPVNAIGVLLKDGIVVDATMGHRLNLKGEGEYTLMVIAVGYPIKTLDVSAGDYTIDLSSNTIQSAEAGSMQVCANTGPQMSAEQAKNRVRSKFGELKDIVGQVRLEFKDCKALYKMKVRKQMRLFGVLPIPFDEELEVAVDAQTGEVS